nr:Dihydrofolate reductase [uncultured bacterium]
MKKGTDIDMKKKGAVISAIAAFGKNRALGKDNDLLWHIPDDLKRFKELTSGHPVIMGRKTWESLPEKFRPLPGRTNVVVTRQVGYAADGAIVVDGLSDAFLTAQDTPGAEETFIIGGAQIYAEALPYTTRLYLTVIDDGKEADVFFPEYETEFTKIISNESREWNGLKYRWVTLER